MRILTAILLASSAILAAGPANDSGADLRSRFSNPPAAFRTMPFLVWNGEVTEADIDRHVDAFHEQGVGGFFIHPRPGLITPYMSDRWYELIRYTVAKAAKLGMQAWLYDENSYPERLCRRACARRDAGIVERRAGAGAEQTHRAPCRRCRQMQGAAEKIRRRLSGRHGQRRGTARLGRLRVLRTRLLPQRRLVRRLLLRGPDPARRDAEVYRADDARLRARRRQRVRTAPLQGIFTDEPNIEPPDRNGMRWTPDLFAQFRSRRGYDLSPSLPSLFEETGDWRKIRHDYFLTLHELFVERWSKPCHEYAAAHNLQVDRPLLGARVAQPARRARQHGHVCLAAGARDRPAVQPVR